MENLEQSNTGVFMRFPRKRNSEILDAIGGVMFIFGIVAFTIFGFAL